MRAQLHLAGGDYGSLHEHLFPGDMDEHAAIALAGVRQRAGGVDLLVREVHPLWEDEFVPGERGYRQISARALARLGNRAADQGLALVSCHSHPGATTRNSLSHDDVAAHERVFPHLLDIVGGPVAGIAFGTESAAGEIWLHGETPSRLDAVRIVSNELRRLTPSPLHTGPVDGRFDRQVRLFGPTGQQVLRRQHVAVVGLGGGGSMLVEQLAHLGVGRITGVDYDVVKRHNLSRIVGATEADARTQRKKVAVASRLVETIDPSIEFTAIDGDVACADVAEQVAVCDFIFLATDTVTSRLVANSIAHAHFVPTIQIGAKVDLQSSGQIESVYVAVRPILPGEGCLQCAGLIDPDALRDEANSDEERVAQNYLGTPEVIDPSVVTLNGIGASTAVHLFLMSSVGLASPSLWKHRLYDARNGAWLELQVAANAGCHWCRRGENTSFGRGDRASIPVRSRSHLSADRAASRRVARRRGLTRRILDRLNGR